ncbi:MAG TPA: YggS family pyridoxal phosphate-dependent enzyme [Holophagaceae bacterium]|nr:YggS family pyridoxal phosphate-dependent enzyme [Holophagaceae bacterium]
MTLADRISQVQARIARACGEAGREPSTVELLPVSKKQPLESIEAAAALGFRRFGENYVQEGAAKAEARPDLAFTLIGPLQRNKAKLALQRFDELQTVDRVDLAHRLARLAEELDLRPGIWIQVDLWDEETKLGGCAEAGLPALLDALKDAPRLELRGLMAIPPPDQPRAFAQLAALRERLRQSLGRDLRLSMGMSHDLEAAIAAGSDQVRIGTAIFGERR